MLEKGKEIYKTRLKELGMLSGVKESECLFFCEKQV